MLDPHTDLILFPDNGSDLIWWILIIYTAIEDMLRAMGFVLVISMIFDVVEDSQVKTGRRDEGIFMTGPGLIQKVLSGLGIFILGLVLQYIGFDLQTANQEIDKTPIDQLVLFQITVQPILLLAGTCCLFFYKISRDSHRGAVNELGYKD